MLGQSECLDGSYMSSLLLLHLLVGIIYPLLGDVRCLDRLKKKKEKKKKKKRKKEREIKIKLREYLVKEMNKKKQKKKAYHR